MQDLAQVIKSDKNIPLTRNELTASQGIGRKSINVIIREAVVSAEGIMCDRNVVRVASRLGIAKDKNATKIKKELMEALRQKMRREMGIAT